MLRLRKYSMSVSQWYCFQIGFFQNSYFRLNPVLPLYNTETDSTYPKCRVYTIRTRHLPPVACADPGTALRLMGRRQI